jgi:ArsR family transcriptional regulator, virulence genes transcriptional regulator
MARKPNSASVSNACGCLKGIAHPTRLMILNFLRGGGRNVGEIVDELGGASQSNVSQHLAQMKACGLLTATRDGNQIYYAATNPRLFDFLDLIGELFCR